MHVNWKKIALLYLAAGAATAGWEYFKGYGIDGMLLLTWPTKVGTIASAPTLNPAPATRTTL